MQFLIIGIDGMDVEAPARRAAARPKHIELGDKLLNAGNLWYGAALFDESGNMNGSMYLVDFASEAEVHAWLRDEPYMTGGVWKKVDIHRANVRDPWQFNRPREFYEESRNKAERHDI